MEIIILSNFPLLLNRSRERQTKTREDKRKESALFLSLSLSSSPALYLSPLGLEEHVTDHIFAHPERFPK